MGTYLIVTLQQASVLSSVLSYHLKQIMTTVTVLHKDSVNSIKSSLDWIPKTTGLLEGFMFPII